MENNSFEKIICTENTVQNSIHEAILNSMHHEADNVQAFLNQPVNLDDPVSLTLRLAGLDGYFARLSDLVARAKTLRDVARATYIQENEDRLNKLSATVSNRQIDAYLLPYAAAYNRLETMYHTTEVLSRNLVTQISYLKKQMEHLGGA